MEIRFPNHHPREEERDLYCFTLNKEREMCSSFPAAENGQNVLRVTLGAFGGGEASPVLQQLIFSQCNTVVGGMEYRVKNPTNRDETYWPESVFISLHPFPNSWRSPSFLSKNDGLEFRSFKSGFSPSPGVFIGMALLLCITFYLYFSLCSEKFHCHQKHLRALFLYPVPR